MLRGKSEIKRVAIRIVITEQSDELSSHPKRGECGETVEQIIIIIHILARDDRGKGHAPRSLGSTVSPSLYGYTRRSPSILIQSDKLALVRFVIITYITLLLLKADKF